MTIGTTIKRLRREHDITQEQLAEYLNISASAISQWETDRVLPDISYVVPLANFFGVSTDELFNRENDAEQKEVDNAIEATQYNDLKAWYNENLALWRGLSQKYPKNYLCLVYLTGALYNEVNRETQSDKRDAIAAEIVSVCERILRDCTEDTHRESAIQMLVCIYSFKQLSIADESKALKYANMACSVWTCREVLVNTAYFTDESVDKARGYRHHTCLDLLDFLCGFLYYPKDTLERRIHALEISLKLWASVVEDENYLFYQWKIADYHNRLAELYAQLGKKFETIEHLKQAILHANLNDHLTIGESYYTAPLISSASSYNLENVDTGARSQLKSILDDMLNKSYYDFIRNDTEFVNIQNLF